MAKKKTKKKARPPLSRKPHDITKDAWFYDERGGIQITHWITAEVNIGQRQATMLKIPHRMLIAALRRAGKI